jgi:hypothetical protein
MPGKKKSPGSGSRERKMEEKPEGGAAVRPRCFKKIDLVL